MIIRPEAEQDIVEAVAWYEEQQAGLGDQFQIALDRVFQQIVLLPEAHRVVYRNVRRVLTRRFPFAVYYLFERGEVIVMAVVHSRRDPGRWKLRAD